MRPAAGGSPPSGRTSRTSASSRTSGSARRRRSTAAATRRCRPSSCVAMARRTSSTAGRPQPCGAAGGLRQRPRRSSSSTTPGRGSGALVDPCSAPVRMIGRCRTPPAPSSPSSTSRSVPRRASAPAVTDLTLTIPAGEICVLVGPSGCGKTTSMKMVNRLIEPTGGRITIDGQDVMAAPGRRAAPRHRLRHPAGGPVPAPDDRRERGGRAPASCAGGGIGSAGASTSCSSSSGSSRRRTAIAIRTSSPVASVSGSAWPGRWRPIPPVMLMDEPFGAVDPIRRERLQNEFLRLQERVRKTIVFVTHDVDEAIKMGDRIAILQRGGILAQYDTPAAILANPASEFVERFVGADRGLKRLSLARVRDLELLAAVIVRSGRGPRRGAAGGSPRSDPRSYALLVDAERPTRWAGSTSTTWPAADRSTPRRPRPAPRRCSRRRRCATPCRRCSGRASSSAWSSTSATASSGWSASTRSATGCVSPSVVPTVTVTRSARTAEAS